jgi:acyl-CoA thioesterase FadM
MNLYLRLLRSLLRGLVAPRISPFEAAESYFRVWINDIDVFGHMNNGRYMQIMDAARVEWMVRCGVAGAMWRNRWSAIVGGGMMRYRHSLHVVQRYCVRTRLLFWDTRWFYLEHTFIDSNERVVAAGIARAALRHSAGWVDTQRVVAEVAPQATVLTEPAFLRDWLAAEEQIFAAEQMPCPEKPPEDGAGTGLGPRRDAACEECA